MFHLVGAYSKTLRNLPSSSKNHILDIVIYLQVLYSHVKFHINIKMYLPLHGFIGLRKLYKYIHFYIYTILYDIK
jgi:hypothetical protein